MGASNSAKAISKAAKSRSYWFGMMVGALLVVGAVGNTAVDIGVAAVQHWPKIRSTGEWFSWGDKVKPVEPAAKESTPDLIRETGYLRMRYTSEKYKTWKISLKGSTTLTGEIEDVETGNKGIVTGYYRGDTLVLTYASMAVGRPGIGSFVLRPYASRNADEPTIYAGGAIVHQCECVDGSVLRNGPMVTVPVLLTNRPMPSDDLVRRFLVNEPEQLKVIFPADIQRRAG